MESTRVGYSLACTRLGWKLLTVTNTLAYYDGRRTFYSTDIKIESKFSQTWNCLSINPHFKHYDMGKHWSWWRHNYHPNDKQPCDTLQICAKV